MGNKKSVPVPEGGHRPPPAPPAQPTILTPDELKKELLRVKNVESKLTEQDQKSVDALKRFIINRVKEPRFKDREINEIKTIEDYGFEINRDVVVNEFKQYEAFFKVRADNYIYIITVNEEIDENITPFDDFSRQFLGAYKQVVQKEILRIQKLIMDAVKIKKTTTTIPLYVNDHLCRKILAHFSAVEKDGFVHLQDNRLVFDLTLLN